MIAIAKAMTDEEIKASAKFYGAIPFASRIKVIESITVPKTRLVAALRIQRCQLTLCELLHAACRAVRTACIAQVAHDAVA